MSGRRVARTLAWLRQHGSRANVDGMAHYGIRSLKVFGVSMQTMRPFIKSLGRDHALALALWETGWLEARILASFVDVPGEVTSRQMEAWVRDFDNWAVCDSVCTHLFDRTPYAWSKARVWSARRAEFVRRGGFSLMAGLAVHDRTAADAAFRSLLPLIERAADDERNS